MRNTLVLTLTLLLIVPAAFAVVPQFWRTRTADDYLAGDIDGFAVTSRGELRPGSALRKIASFADPFVLSQASAPSGDVYFGTGNAGKIYRLHNGELKLFYTAPESEIYSILFHDGAIYAGTSPNGKVYRIDESGKASAFYDPKQAYIWSLAFLPGGDLAVATGVEGKLFRVTPKGEGKLWFDAADTHLRCMAVRGDGSVLAGASAKGRIYEVHADGSARALFDSSLNEISTIWIDSKGIGWAAGVSNVLPATAPAKAPPAKGGQQTTASNSTSTSGAETKKEGEGSATVEVGFSFEEGSGGSSQAGSGEIYKIHPDGFVETVRKFDREMVYAITGSAGGGILLSTGPQGRIYEIRDGEAALVGTVPEKQIVSIVSNAGGTLVSTTNSGAVYRMENAPSAKGELRSPVKDVERFSRFGHYRIEGTDLGDNHIAIAFRSGNTRTPDATWSAWTLPSSFAEGTNGAPAGRYIQWKLTMPKPSASLAVSAVIVSYINRNIAPSIDSLVVNEPAVVFITSSYPPSPQVVEATNPDEYGIFTSLENPRDKQEPGKKVFRKGFRTISWRAHDENGDALRYSVAFRRKGTDRWLRLRDNMEESSLNFDTTQLPDGVYELRLTATDANDNPENPLTDVKEGIEFQIDNTPPSIAVTTSGDDVLIRVTDKLSTVGKVEYSADAQKWIRLTPVDGIADSGDETYKLKRSAIEGKFVIIRAVDSFYNVATEAVTIR